MPNGANPIAGAALVGFANLKLYGLYAIRETCCFPGIGRDGYGKGARALDVAQTTWGSVGYGPISRVLCFACT